MPLPQMPINTAPNFGERLISSGTISSGVESILGGIIKGKQLADFKKFVAMGEDGSRALYQKVLADYPELAGQIPEPYFDPRKPTEYILTLAKATKEYKERHSLASAFREAGLKMQERSRAPLETPAPQAGVATESAPGAGTQPTQRNFLQAVPQQDPATMMGLMAVGAETGTLKDMLSAIGELTTGLSEAAKSQREILKVASEAVTKAAEVTPYRPSFGNVNMRDIAAGQLGFIEERKLKPQRQAASGTPDYQLRQYFDTIRNAAAQLTTTTDKALPDVRRAIALQIEGADPKTALAGFDQSSRILLGTIRNVISEVARIQGRREQDVLSDFFGEPEPEVPVAPAAPVPQGFAR